MEARAASECWIVPRLEVSALGGFWCQGYGPFEIQVVKESGIIRVGYW